MARTRRTEARTRYYCREEARRLGWNTAHPKNGGAFVEENEIVAHFPALAKCLGQEKPDFLVLRGTKLAMVIETKADFREIKCALEEAVYYADQIRNRKDVRVAVGISGTPDTAVQVRVRFFNGKTWVPLCSHAYPLTQIPSPDEIETALENSDGTTDAKLPAEVEFYDAAVRISRLLRLAKVEEPARPKILGALILALYQGEFSTDPDTTIGQINTNVKAAIDKCADVPHDRRSTLINTLHLPNDLPPLAQAIQPLVQQLERLNVRSIMRSSVDFLGQFYEAFLRYGCGSTQLGVVFTPRHITRFCANMVGVQLGMSVYDPACGTGGFLVAAYDSMMKEATSPKARSEVKRSLFGLDTNSTVWALCVLNMIFRGDGKSNVALGSCFDANDATRFDRVLMNPPFAQDEEPEIAFVDHALSRLRAGGEVAIVLPTGVLVDDEHRAWRAALVETHNVLGAVSLPTELFYPTGAATTILLVRAHSPSVDGKAFFAKVLNDGFTISKGKRIGCDGSQLPKVLELFGQFKRKRFEGIEPGLAVTVAQSKLTAGDELCAEHWLPQIPLSKNVFLTQRSYLLRQMCLAAVTYPGITDSLIADYTARLSNIDVKNEARPGQPWKVDALFKVHMGLSSGEANYPRGVVPYVSSGDTYNSIVALVDPPHEEVIDEPCLAMTGFGQVHLQPWRFLARGNGGSAVRILRPRFPMSVAELLWHAAQINAQRWRFHYGRMAILPRIRALVLDSLPNWANLEIDLPGVVAAFHKGLSKLLPN